MNLSKEKKEILKNIGLIALDLDYTTLTKSGLTPRTRETLEEAIRRGYQVVIATGRPLVAIPDEIMKIEGLQYIICSNGAHIVDVRTGDFLFSSYLSRESSLMLRERLMEIDHPIELFTGGRAFVSEELFEDLKCNGSCYLATKYILRTRQPVPDIWKFWEENLTTIENINIHFEHLDDKLRMIQELNEVGGFTLTSSTKNNIEIEGMDTSKASALAKLSEISGVGLERVISFGDSPNDESMIAESGFGVAVDNAVDEIKAVADYITLSNEEEGVAYAIRTLLFNEENGVPKGRGSLFRTIAKKIKRG